MRSRQLLPTLVSVLALAGASVATVLVAAPAGADHEAGHDFTFTSSTGFMLCRDDPGDDPPAFSPLCEFAGFGETEEGFQPDGSPAPAPAPTEREHSRPVCFPPGSDVHVSVGAHAEQAVQGGFVGPAPVPDAPGTLLVTGPDGFLFEEEFITPRLDDPPFAGPVLIQLGVLAPGTYTVTATIDTFLLTLPAGNKALILGSTATTTLDIDEDCPEPEPGKPGLGCGDPIHRHDGPPTDKVPFNRALCPEQAGQK